MFDKILSVILIYVSLQNLLKYKVQLYYSVWHQRTMWAYADTLAYADTR